MSLFSAKIILINYLLIRDEFWIFEYMMGQLKKKKMIKKKEERDSRVKTQNGSLEWKQENPKDSWAERTKEWKVNNQEASKASMRSLIPSKTRELEPSICECLSQTPESITVGLDTSQIVIFKN